MESNLAPLYIHVLDTAHMLYESGDLVATKAYERRAMDGSGCRLAWTVQPKNHHGFPE